MGLYRLFSYNVEVQYQSYFLSKAMMFTIITTILNIILPFLIAYGSRGFWVKSHSFYEQPGVHFTYEYLLIAETNDPSQPIVCSEVNGLNIINEENCAVMQVQEYDENEDGKNDILDFMFHLNVPQNETVTSVLIILGLDFKLQTVCPLQMQSLIVINREFVVPPSGLRYYGDLQFYQTLLLPCKSNYIDIKYNSSIFNFQRSNQDNTVDFMLKKYFLREVTIFTKTIHSRANNGHTSFMKLQICLRVPKMKVVYIPSILQELKWAWPQYLSLLIIFYWILDKIKRFVFHHRLLMAWKIVPWNKN